MTDVFVPNYDGYDCTCEPGRSDPECPVMVPPDITEDRETYSPENPCAHCNSGAAYCEHLKVVADIGGCCTPCQIKVTH